MFSFAEVCPALSSTSVDISCSYRGEIVSCSESILPGTRATLSCKSSYKLSLTNDPAYRKITCLDDGLWDRRIFRCLPGEHTCHFRAIDAKRNLDESHALAASHLTMLNIYFNSCLLILDYSNDVVIPRVRSPFNPYFFVRNGFLHAQHMITFSRCFLTCDL